jgi:hypothetical protein
MRSCSETCGFTRGTDELFVSNVMELMVNATLAITNHQYAHAHAHAHAQAQAQAQSALHVMFMHAMPPTVKVIVSAQRTNAQEIHNHREPIDKVFLHRLFMCH